MSDIVYKRTIEPEVSNIYPQKEYGHSSIRLLVWVWVVGEGDRSDQSNLQLT